jgi:4-hydroxy-tetrahydrodipicolinate reductase
VTDRSSFFIVAKKFMISLLVTGKSGRMGQSVIEAAKQAGVTVTSTHDAGEDLLLAVSRRS